MDATKSQKDDSPAQALMEARGLQKSFGAVRALQHADLRLLQGTVTALVGDNGAGKSTLVRCLTGVHPPDKGELLLEGQAVHFSSPEACRALGIETVYQNLALIEDLPVWQNLYLRRELRKGAGIFSILDKPAMRNQAGEILKELDVNIPSIRSRVRNMSGGQRQSIAIARAAHWGRRVVVMDEPTAALGVRETAAVEQLVHRLRERGVTVLLISHDMAQVKRLANSVVVLRRGRTVARREIEDVSPDDLVALITGAQKGDDDNFTA